MEQSGNYRFPDDFVNRIIHGDALQLVKLLPDSSIDAVLTDPPYGLGSKGIKYDEDLAVYYNILPELYRVLKPDSFFITFFSIKFLPLAFLNNPFRYIWQCILYCPRGHVKSPIGYTKYMLVLVFAKGTPVIVRGSKDIFVATPGSAVEPDEGYIDHPTPKPKRFIKELIEMFTHEGDIILDPFIGSGSTAVACILSKRNFIGFEIDESYCKLARQRVDRFASRNSNVLLHQHSLFDEH